ncbi:ABC transporter substrate-binding protein [Aureimonas psammosilenae]|uniref:ABC transporter substrate-binding protein n=1 Tax=Aureimonas psammosilenae TaxID=2495496 RepID=UPI0012611FD3|nr:ABC transporter substrate-binding protein [Aureimonas psammosilenae]
MPGFILHPTRRGFVAGALLAGLRRPASASVPIRVASMDYTLAEICVVLGAPAFAVAGAEDWGKWVVEPPLPPGTIDIGDRQTANYELLARLAPELILTTPYLDSVLPTLERIAPVLRVGIYEEGAEPLPRSIDATRLLGERLDRREVAEAYLAQSDARFDDLARRVRRLGAPPVLSIGFVDARHVRVFGGKGLFQGALDRIALPNAYTGPTSYWGFETIGIEELARYGDAHLMIFEPVPPDVMPTLQRTPLWTELPFVEEARVSVLPPALTFGGVATALRFADLVVGELERQAA